MNSGYRIFPSPGLRGHQRVVHIVDEFDQRSGDPGCRSIMVADTDAGRLQIEIDALILDEGPPSL